ncbi:MAG: DUF2284 domain-containing protein [Anaerovoracaceae bacterium]
MENNTKDALKFQHVVDMAIFEGASHAGILPVSSIDFDSEFRAACEANRCGSFNKNWKCPPEVGDIHELIQIAKSYDFALVVQGIYPLKSKFDYAGMISAGSNLQITTRKIAEGMEKKGMDVLPLGVGPCTFCQRCSKLKDSPCVFPDKAMASIEAYGMDVMRLVKKCNMTYYNGENTTTVFGACLFRV